MVESSVGSVVAWLGSNSAAAAGVVMMSRMMFCWVVGLVLW